MKFVSFSERYRYIKLDDALQIERMNEGLKNVLGSYLYQQYQKIDFEEAKYMLVVCSAFVNYLKAKQIKISAE